MSDEITLSEAARRLGITTQSAGMWVKRPGAPARAEGRKVLVRWPAFIRWREQELVSTAVEQASAGDLEKERTRKTAAEASLAELELAKARGEFVSIADYETALGRVLDILVARLRAMPIRLSHFGSDVEAEAEKEAERIITELSQFDEDIFPEDELSPAEAIAA